MNDAPTGGPPAASLKIEAVYDYVDEGGAILYQHVRYVPKDFKWRRSDGKGGSIWNLNGVRRVPYRLPDLIEAREAGELIIVVEGEKDADNLALLELMATTGGSVNDWKTEFSEYLEGATVAIIPDNDLPGQKYAETVAALLADVAGSVKIINLPDLPEHGDVSDWIAAGGSREALLEMIEAAPLWKPPVETAPNTDSANARRFVAKYGDVVRYDYTRRRWYYWDGKVWTEDKNGEVERRAGEVVKEIYKETAKQNDKDHRDLLGSWARQSESAKSRRDMLTLAKSELPIAAVAENFDRDPWLLCCANGTIDLRTGDLRPHRKSDLITRLIPVAFDLAARYEDWEKFLFDSTGGDQEFIAFLMRIIGYCLTGDSRHEALFFIHGPAATGKTTFAETLKTLLGEFAATADFDSFIDAQQSGANGARSDLARLAGRRAVFCSEVSKGRRFNEKLIKNLTGGDTITARFLYGELFEFKPQFKLILAGNHAPALSDDDPAIWRRMIRIPFTREIPADKRDLTLKKRLCDPKQGLPAILASAVRGCLDWQARGNDLGVPEVVADYTMAYRTENDPLAEFIEDCIIIEELREVKTADLWKNYAAWANENRRKPIKKSDFNKRIVNLDNGKIEKVHRNSGDFWRGLRLTEREQTSTIYDSYGGR